MRTKIDKSRFLSGSMVRALQAARTHGNAKRAPVHHYTPSFMAMLERMRSQGLLDKAYNITGKGNVALDSGQIPE